MSSYSAHPDDLPIQVQDRRKRGYFTVDNIFLDAYGKLLKAHGIAVYVALARFANQEDECWPSRRAIHERTGVSIPQINREINKLVSYSLITVAPQYNEAGDQTSNLYTLLDVPETPHITQIPLGISNRDPARIRQIPKQSLKKKVTPSNSNKKSKSEKRGNYRPAEYADIILG